MISIIVPVYKVEKYLSECVESILAQTYRDFELILVDDGSPDRCPEICDDYAKKDSRIRVIHKKNGGLSSARNAGLDVARGEYIGFVDSDDFIHPEMYARLLTKLEATGSDLCLCNFIKTSETGFLLDDSDHGFAFPSETLSYHEIIKWLENNSLSWQYVTAVNRLYRREIFTTLRFPEGKNHEDEFVFLDVFLSCKGISFTK